jgi:tetratricopeptide (TPR) repeat protein
VGAGFYSGGTKYGLFGIHLVEPFLPGSGDEVAVTQAIESAELVAAEDTYAATRLALTQLADERRDAGLNRSLVARSLLHESYYQIRFGGDPESGSVADGLRLHLQRRGDEAPRIHVALAADALRNADTATASSEIALAAQEDPTDSYVDLVAGEIALSKREGQAAVDAFTRALEKHDSARAQWGLSRAYRVLDQRQPSVAAAKATLEASPKHAGARVAVAEQHIVDGEIEEAAALLEAPAGLTPVDGATLQVSRTDKSAALALIARIEEQRGRLGAAREMYEKAIELDTSNAEAALGAARLVLLEGAYQDALARFQTVLGSELAPGAPVDPTGKPRVVVEAKLGAAEALLAMNKPQDAKKLLADLTTPEPVNANVEIWQGKVAAALGESKEAVRHFRNAITLDPTAIGAYIALATHYTDTRRPGEAVGVLVEAQKNVEITAEVRRLLGRAELQRGRLDEAIKQLSAALEMEPRDSSAEFGLAEAYRRKRMFAEAAASLAKVEEFDSKFPGLLLEKGRLAEAQGDMEGAIAGYRAALAESPDDAALKSRLGAALVLTGELGEAETLLREVLKVQPYSAEAEHFLGRIELQRGQVEASRQRLQRAARLAPDNGTYRMYVAWAELESNEMTPALRDLEAALKLDESLGDAYWLRARIRIRAGTVRDALADLQRALELNPNRVEAWAAMGECHYQLGEVTAAVSDFEKAVEGQPDNAYWWYRLGRLQLDEGMRQKARASLTRSVSLGDEAPKEHGWLADAHRLIGDIDYAQGKRQDAIVAYGRYLELADADAIDRPDVEAKLDKMSRALR